MNHTINVKEFIEPVPMWEDIWNQSIEAIRNEYQHLICVDNIVCE